MISGVVLVRNEERNITSCLNCLRPQVEEIILIDMESSDSTLEIAMPLVDKVLHHPLVHNFDAARNLAIPVAEYDWMWIVDADERVSGRTGKLVRELIHNRGHEFEAITIPFKSYFCQQWMQHCGWWPGYTMPRVLKRGHFRFVERLHGGVEVSGRTIRLSPDPGIAVDHFSYESIEHYVEKLNRYTSTEANQLTESNHLFDWKEALRHMMFDLWQYYERNQGHLDGVRGWILSWLSGQYRWLSHAKLIDQPFSEINQSSHDGVPESLDSVLQTMEEMLAECRASHPRLPLGIVWRGPLWDPSGYADESRAFVKGLAQGCRTLGIQDIHWASAQIELDRQDSALLRALSRTRRSPSTATITNCIPTLVKPDPLSSVNILRTTFETDRLPSGWLAHILEFDEVWVISQYNYCSFVRSWVPPEKLRVVPSCIDTDLFRPDGESIELPIATQNRFVFLSVFDWGWRKGWDILVKAYSQAFSPEDGKSLLLKITRNHGHPVEYIHQQIDEALKSVGQSLIGRQDIVLWDENLDSQKLAALYRSVDAFVLPSRGEGWGRPYMEAMASGLPTIGTRASGNMDFMNDTNSYLIDAQLEPVPQKAFREIPTYEGHWWHEPDMLELRNAMRHVAQGSALVREVGTRASTFVREQYSVVKGENAIEVALSSAEERFNHSYQPISQQGQIQVELEGELFAGHSFSKINEELIRQAANDDDVALTVRKVVFNPDCEPSTPRERELLPFVNRPLAGDTQVTIRHCFPPNWEKPCTGKWVHIQPWEFGHLPSDWIMPLRDLVDEIWVPSTYVRKVYEQSGIPRAKIQLIPWGIDPSLYHPEAIPLLLPTSKRFRFLFVGGAIPRKGFDIVLEAYLQEFSPYEDVALVVKDMGGQSFYRYGNLREPLAKAVADRDNPEIVHIDKHITEMQMPHLYTACDCQVAPYRGEGFGLPVLEAMACGLPPIVPKGGATDDFVDDRCGFLLESAEIETRHDWELVGPCKELEVDVQLLRRKMRRAFESIAEVKEVGAHAASFSRERYTWQATWQLMKRRLIELAGTTYSTCAAKKNVATDAVTQVGSRITVGVEVRNNEEFLAECLSRLQLVSDDVIVFDKASRDRSAAIANEYGAEVISANTNVTKEALRSILKRRSSDWSLLLQASDLVDEGILEKLCVHIEQCSLKESSKLFSAHILQGNTRKEAFRRLRLVRKSKDTS